MTLQFFDGLQDPVLTTKPEVALSAVSAATGRDGSTNGAGLLSGSSAATYTVTLPTTAATAITGIAFQISTLAVSTLMSWQASGTTQLVLIVNASGFLELRRSTITGTLLASTTSADHVAIPINTWQHVQTSGSLHTSTGSVTVKLNGVTVLTFTGATSGAIANVDKVRAQANSAGSNLTVDDFWLCDGVDATSTQGRTNNGFLGDLGVKTLFPTGAGDTTQWTPSTGANYAAVDETPPNTTDYVAASSSSGVRDLYALADLPTNAQNVFGIRATLYAQKTDSGAASISPTYKESGGTVTVQTAQPLSTTYAPYSGAMLATKPSASTTPWTVSDVNGLQAGADAA